MEHPDWLFPFGFPSKSCFFLSLPPFGEPPPRKKTTHVQSERLQIQANSRQVANAVPRPQGHPELPVVDLACAKRWGQREWVAKPSAFTSCEWSPLDSEIDSLESQQGKIEHIILSETWPSGVLQKAYFADAAACLVYLDPQVDS